MFTALGLRLSMFMGSALAEPLDRAGAARTAWMARRTGRFPVARLEIAIVNVRTGKGPVHVGLFNAETPFPESGADLESAMVVAQSLRMTVIFERIPYGLYAAAAFQDLNGNGEFDTAFGMPLEPCGFSNGATAGIGGPPSFRAAAFGVDAPMSIATIVL